mmetsp:Transcript_52685/g.111928  ORF Transcript_52685/g.111928 Transcript_52685/m.111928 type:complete len:209 (-) Transcript_52685:60-686(-)
MMRRMITQSRWPKFMGWQHPLIHNNCENIFYLDSSARPKTHDEYGRPLPGFVSTLQRYSTKVKHSKVGFAIPVHPKARTVSSELPAITEFGKDTAEHIEATSQWFHQQADYQDNIPIFQLTYFMYNVESVHWRNVSNFFWSHYSKEVLIWRDQPLFAYSLHHLDCGSEYMENDLFRNERTGFGGHLYNKGHELRPIVFPGTVGGVTKS